MSEFDLNNLSADIEVGADVTEYEEPTDKFPPIPKGDYNLKLDDNQTITWKEMGGKGKGNVYASVKFSVVDGPFQGRVIFEMLSTMVSTFRKASSVQDYLFAVEYAGEPANGKRYTLQELADAIDDCKNSGYPFTAKTDIEVYCKECKKTLLKGERNLPKGDDGEPIYDVVCPTCGEVCTASTKIKKYQKLQ